MTEAPRFVIDASVAIKWYLNDEEHVELANRVQEDFARGLIRLLAPPQLLHEIASAALKATRYSQRPKTLSFIEGQLIVEAFLNWEIELVDHEILVPAAYQMAGRYGCSYYDGLFLATAEMTNSPFVYADGKLRRALGSGFPLGVWIEDYQPA